MKYLVLLLVIFSSCKEDCFECNQWTDQHIYRWQDSMTGSLSYSVWTTPVLTQTKVCDGETQPLPSEVTTKMDDSTYVTTRVQVQCR